MTSVSLNPSTLRCTMTGARLASSSRPDRPREEVGIDVASGLADMEAYGQMILANPDFRGRLNAEASMNEADRMTFLGGTEKGYTDCPTL